MLVLTACLAQGARIERVRLYTEHWTRLSGWTLIVIGVFLTIRVAMP